MLINSANRRLAFYATNRDTLFSVSELALMILENVLHLTAYGGLAVLDPPVPVDGAVRYMRQAFGAAVDASNT